MRGDGSCGSASSRRSRRANGDWPTAAGAQTGAILRTFDSNRFVTGVTWVEGERWHATRERDESDLRRLDPETGQVLERLEMPAGAGISGLESDAGERGDAVPCNGRARR